MRTRAGIAAPGAGAGAGFKVASCVFLCAFLGLALNQTSCAPQDDPSVEASPRVVRRSALTCKPVEVSEQTFKVMRALEPHCAGCHQQGTRGYFQSPEAFQSLLVGDPAQVKPGDPDASELIRLLEGQGTGAFDRMPIGLKSYAELAQDDPTMMPMRELRAWVMALPPQARDSSPKASAPTVRRLRADQLQRALYAQLGLSDADFYGPASNYQIPMVNARDDNRYPVRSPEAVPAPFDRPSSERFFALGGGSALDQAPADEGVSPTAALTLTQVSQAWCRLAITKPGNAALFDAQTPRGAQPAQVEAIVRRWGVVFWGERLDEARVKPLVEKLFMPLLAQGDEESALTGLCSYFIRHPRWIFY